MDRTITVSIIVTGGAAAIGVITGANKKGGPFGTLGRVAIGTVFLGVFLSLASLANRQIATDLAVVIAIGSVLLNGTVVFSAIAGAVK